MFYQDIIPAAKMYKYKWYHPQGENHWYYYQPRLQPILNQNNKEIYDTLDPELKRIFALVVNKGYKTLPSCQGHFHTTQDILKKYYNVLNNLIKIKTDGLVLVDTETGKETLFQDRNYHKPWKNFEEFLHNTQTVMQNGYFGILNPKGIKPFQNDSIKIELNKDYFGIPVANINVHNQNQNSVKQNWDIVYDILSYLLV